VFADAARLLGRARSVHTMGLGISALLAQVMAYSLRQVAVSATAFAHDETTFIEQLPFVGKRDVLVAFSFPPYSRETVDVVRLAAKRGVAVIGITDRETSPISFACRHVLPIRSSNMLFTNSISAISVVVNALVTEVALHRRSRALTLQREIDRQLRRSGHFTQEH
jgi:DNA-binding MurR/RpiR family transcriptional regulator